MSDIDWERVRRIMEKSVRHGGQTLTDEEGGIITTAWCRAPDEYRKVHDEVREAAHEEMRTSRRARCA